VAEADPPPAPPSGELQSGQGVDRDGVRGDQRGHIADDYIGIAALQRRADALTEPRNVAASDRTGDD
jgi:hypothetical protein